MDKALLALSPTPECLFLASRIRPRWGEMAIAGAKLLPGLLERWACEQPGTLAIVLVADVLDPAAMRHALEVFTGAGGHVLWLAREDSAAVLKACTGLERVKLALGGSLFTAAESVFPTRPLEPAFAQAELQDYLRYKITISFMRLMDPAPLLEAVETLARWKGEKFELARAARADAGSVRHFRETDFPYLEGHSETVMALKRRIMALGATPMSVLIVGETGTGKEAVAFYLHEFSPRRAGPFVSINCAGLDENHLRSELFGHKRGAFTGAIADRKGLVEQASGGTLFFDELGDMPLSVQADLLRFLQTRRFRPLGSDVEVQADVRLVAAAQPCIHEKLRLGEFRPDLYHRIAEVELATPRLAEVPEDIIRIVRNIAYRHRGPGQIEVGERIRETIDYFNRGQTILQTCPWPGNVRELARYVRRRLFLGDDVLPEIANTKPTMTRSNECCPICEAIIDASMIKPVDSVVRRYVTYAWRNRGEITQQELASRLGIAINTLKKYLD